MDLDSWNPRWIWAKSKSISFNLPKQRIWIWGPLNPNSNSNSNPNPCRPNRPQENLHSRQWLCQQNFQGQAPIKYSFLNWNPEPEALLRERVRSSPLLSILAWSSPYVISKSSLVQVTSRGRESQAWEYWSTASREMLKERSLGNLIADNWNYE